jgi:hypothetical protein
MTWMALCGRLPIMHLYVNPAADFAKAYCRAWKLATDAVVA